MAVEVLPCPSWPNPLFPHENTWAVRERRFGTCRRCVQSACAHKAMLGGRGGACGGVGGRRVADLAAVGDGVGGVVARGNGRDDQPRERLDLGRVRLVRGEGRGVTD